MHSVILASRRHDEIEDARRSAASVRFIQAFHRRLFRIGQKLRLHSGGVLDPVSDLVHPGVESAHQLDGILRSWDPDRLLQRRFAQTCIGCGELAAALRSFQSMVVVAPSMGV